MKHRNIALPISLLLGTIIVLIGCIPIPSTKQFQPDGKLRPEYLIGPGSDKPIQLNRTSFVDAFIVLSRQTSFRSGAFMELNAPLPGIYVTNWAKLSRWRISADHRHAFVPFQVRSGIVIYPLCFSVVTLGENRWLELEIDERGIVTGSRTHDDRFPPPSTQMPDWSPVFDADAVAKLRAAGVYPSEAEFSAFYERRPRNGRKPTTQQ